MIHRKQGLEGDVVDRLEDVLEGERELCLCQVMCQWLGLPRTITFFQVRIL